MWRRLGKLGFDGRAVWIFQIVTLLVTGLQIGFSAGGADSIGMNDPVSGLAIVAAFFASVVGLRAGWTGNAKSFFGWTLAAQIASAIQFASVSTGAAQYWAWAMSTGDPSVEFSANSLVAWNAMVLATTTIVGLVCVAGLHRHSSRRTIAAG